MENFDTLTPVDRSSLAFAACVGGTTIVGAAVVGLGTGENVLGFVAGAAGGLAWGSQVFCPWVAPAIERAIKKNLMDGKDFSVMMNGLSKRFPDKSRGELLSLGHVVVAGIRNGAYEPKTSNIA